MKILEIVQSLNGTSTSTEIAKTLGVSKDTLRKDLNKCGYVYDNSKKKYVYKGTTEKKQGIDNALYSDIRKLPPNTSQQLPKPINREDTVKKQSNSSIPPLTDTEILQLRALLSDKDTDNMQENHSIFSDIALLPARKSIKKYTVELSEDIYNEFDSFAKRYSNQRIGKATLVELALFKLMQEYK